MLYLTSDDVDPRTVWRMTQIVARTLDAQFPFWWNDTEMVRIYATCTSPRHARCWTQHIRQRLGE